MSDEVWESIVGDLSGQEYDGWFAFHNYNEPLLDPRLEERVVDARRRLRLAKLTVYTNGDFLTGKRLEALAECGLDEVRVTLYPARSRALAEPTLKSLARLCRRLDMSFNSDEVTDRGDRLELTTCKAGVSLHVIVPRIRAYTNRGGSVGLKVLGGRPRCAPCSLPQQSAAVDVDGWLKLCCEIFDARDPANAPYVIGNVLRGGLMALWRSERMDRMRRATSAGDFDELAVCQSCTNGLTLTGDHS